MSAEQIPDLVLLDVLLPRLSGFEVLEKLHAESKTIPRIIMFSNFAQQEDIERAKKLGAKEYIVKAAFSPAEILSKVKEYLEMKIVPDAPTQDQVQSVPVTISPKVSIPVRRPVIAPSPLSTPGMVPPPVPTPPPARPLQA